MLLTRSAYLLLALLTTPAMAAPIDWNATEEQVGGTKMPSGKVRVTGSEQGLPIYMFYDFDGSGVLASVTINPIKGGADCPAFASIFRQGAPVLGLGELRYSFDVEGAHAVYVESPLGPVQFCRVTYTRL